MLNDNHTYSAVPLEFLEDDSFTMSYFLEGEEEQGWVSFHDYIPDYSITLRNNTLLHFYNGQLYEHNVGLKGVYFGQRYSSVLVPVFAPKLKDGEKALYPFTIKSINWSTDVEDNKRRLLQETWTSISLHNSFQGTRQLPLIVFDKECALLEQYGKFNVKRVKNRWYFNYAFNEKDSIFERTWIEIKDKFLPINTEDKECIQEELYKTKLLDEFLILRLVFNNEDNKRLFQYEMNLEFLINTQ